MNPGIHDQLARERRNDLLREAARPRVSDRGPRRRVLRLSVGTQLIRLGSRLARI